MVPFPFRPYLPVKRLRTVCCRNEIDTLGLLGDLVEKRRIPRLRMETMRNGE